MPKQSHGILFMVPPSSLPSADDRVYDEVIRMVTDQRDDRPDLIRLIHLILSVNVPTPAEIRMAANAQGRAGTVAITIPQVLADVRAVPSSRRRRKL